MTDQKENPLVAALPPQTDYLTYLTIVEYNLDKSQLDVLHDLLQDTKLTTNIGWDLVHLLLPLLPESEQCLQDISFLGNPRETVLKVAELLEHLGQSEGSVQEEPNNEDDDDEEEEPDKAMEEEPIDMLSLQFQSLLHMLCILHPRIKTKSPSRFLTTSLKSVITAFKNLQQSADHVQSDERLQSAMRAILMLIKSMSGSKRPHLPPRRSQSAIPTVKSGEPAPDPEGNDETIGPGETELKRRILQSFVTHVLEVYVQSLEPIGLVDSALAWSTRNYEKKHPVPGKPKFAQVSEAEQELERADATISQLLSTAESDLQMSWAELLHCALDEANTDENNKSIFTIDDLPASRPGALYCLAAKASNSLINDRPLPFSISVFPEHCVLIELYVDNLSKDIENDALIVLGSAAFESGGLGEWETRAEFNEYLQRLSQLAADSSLPNIASQASELTSTVLHSHPSSDARFDFIQDTLENCPYPELKEAAVIWLKDEISKAFGMTTSVSKKVEEAQEEQEAQSSSFGETSNVFTHSESLKQAAPWVFAQPMPEGRTDMSPGIQAKFWLAALNLYYLLCASSKLYEALEVQALAVQFNIEKDFVDVLDAMAKKHKESEHEGGSEGYGPFIPLIEDALSRLKDARAKRTGNT